MLAFRLQTTREGFVRGLTEKQQGFHHRDMHSLRWTVPVTNPATGAGQTKMSYLWQVGKVFVGCGVHKNLIAA